MTHDQPPLISSIKGLVIHQVKKQLRQAAIYTNVHAVMV